MSEKIKTPGDHVRIATLKTESVQLTRDVREVTEILLVAWLRVAKNIYPVRKKCRGNQGVWIFEDTEEFRTGVTSYYGSECEIVRRVFDEIKSLKAELALMR